MVNNLPMILLILRTWSFILLCLLTTASVQAHPGHDGHEDGGEITWTYEHVTAHPLATSLCAIIVVLTLWLTFRHFRAKQRQPKGAAAHSLAVDRNS